MIGGGGGGGGVISSDVWTTRGELSEIWDRPRAPICALIGERGVRAGEGEPAQKAYLGIVGT